VGETEALYGSVTSADVADAMLAKGFEIDRRKLNLREPIKKLGEYDIPTAASGARCIASMSNGRLYFTQYDAGLIGEIILD